MDCETKKIRERALRALNIHPKGPFIETAKQLHLDAQNALLVGLLVLEFRRLFTHEISSSTGVKPTLIALTRMVTNEEDYGYSDMWIGDLTAAVEAIKQGKLEG